jgi:hypothetical protein
MTDGLVLVPREPTEAMLRTMGDYRHNASAKVAWAAILAAAPPVDGWQAIETAPKDRTSVLAAIHADLFPRICPGRPDLERWNGQRVVIHHPGVCEDGFDMGWSVSAPVGCGIGCDDWFAGWMPLPQPPNNEKTP